MVTGNFKAYKYELFPQRNVINDRMNHKKEKSKLNCN